MRKKAYITPFTEAISVKVETLLIGETGVDTGDGKTPIVPVSGLDDDEEIAAKHHNLWEDDEEEW